MNLEHCTFFEHLPFVYFMRQTEAALSTLEFLLMKQASSGLTVVLYGGCFTSGGPHLRKGLLDSTVGFLEEPCPIMGAYLVLPAHVS
jgi:hypothetical protein